jgi:hypothetical protein
MTPNRFAKYKRRSPGERNKTEAAYEAYLELAKKAGAIRDYKFEGIKLKLASNTFYTPDFIVFAADDVVELHDTKGTTKKKKADGTKVQAPWIEEDARLKLKLVAELYPFRVFAVFKTFDGWEKLAF